MCSLTVLTCFTATTSLDGMRPSSRLSSMAVKMNLRLPTRLPSAALGSHTGEMDPNIWLRQELKEWQCLFVGHKS